MHAGSTQIDIAPALIGKELEDMQSLRNNLITSLHSPMQKCIGYYNIIIAIIAVAYMYTYKCIQLAHPIIHVTVKAFPIKSLGDFK